MDEQKRPRAWVYARIPGDYDGTMNSYKVCSMQALHDGCDIVGGSIDERGGWLLRPGYRDMLRQIEAGKGGKVRTVPLMKQTVELLQSYFTENGITPQKSPDMPLFWSGNYRKLTRSGITYIVQKYAAAAQAISTDIPATISPHVFRHTKAMHLVQANVNTIYIKDYLGHADISTTEVYARADNEAKRAALEKASLCLELPCASNWEQDADLIAWLSSLG